MAVVTEHLVQLIAKQVDDKGLVVWYAPEQAYGKTCSKYISRIRLHRWRRSQYFLVMSKLVP